jgi:hypothetical protein
MNLEYAGSLLSKLESSGFEPVLIGGIAVQIAGYGATRDIDLVLSIAEFDRVEGSFEEDPEVHIITNTAGWLLNGRYFPKGNRKRRGPYVTFDILNPEKFVGRKHSGESFFRFVISSGSRRTQYGRVATPPVVYYTRLLVPGSHGAAYLDRISRDLDEGAPDEWVRDTVAIAKRFGTEKIVKRRILELRELRTSLKTRP